MKKRNKGKKQASDERSNLYCFGEPSQVGHSIMTRVKIYEIVNSVKLFARSAAAKAAILEGGQLATTTVAEMLDSCTGC